MGGRIGQFLGAVSSRRQYDSGGGIHDDGAHGHFTAFSGGLRLRQGLLHGLEAGAVLQHVVFIMKAELRGVRASVKEDIERIPA
jgi:hypothetical protein